MIPVADIDRERYSIDPKQTQGPLQRAATPTEATQQLPGPNYPITALDCPCVMRPPLCILRERALSVLRVRLSLLYTSPRPRNTVGPYRQGGNSATTIDLSFLPFPLTSQRSPCTSYNITT